MGKGPFGLDSLREDVGNKVDQVAGKDLSTNDLTNDLVEEIGKVKNKVDKVTGKGLSTHDYDDTAKESVDNMGTAASRNVTESSTDTTPGRLLKSGDWAMGTVKKTYAKVIKVLEQSTREIGRLTLPSMSSAQVKVTVNARSSQGIPAQTSTTVIYNVQRALGSSATVNELLAAQPSVFAAAAPNLRHPVVSDNTIIFGVSAASNGTGTKYDYTCVVEIVSSNSISFAFAADDTPFTPAISYPLGLRYEGQLVYHTGNTTVDSNGFIKQASPIVRLFADRIEEHLEPQGANFSKVDTGHYRISGTLGFAKDGWYIETPKDANGQIKFITEHSQESDGTIVIKTYEPTGQGWRPDKGDPVDITDGRWIDLRLCPHPIESKEEIGKLEEKGQ